MKRNPNGKKEDQLFLSPGKSRIDCHFSDEVDCPMLA